MQIKIKNKIIQIIISCYSEFTKPKERALICSLKRSQYFSY